jgi:hypothetical protein
MVVNIIGMGNSRMIEAVLCGLPNAEFWVYVIYNQRA